MRPVLPGDISAASRALLAVPTRARRALAARLLQEASAADCYRKRYCKAHAQWGNGTLMAAAMKRPLGREPRLDDYEYLECQCLVFEALRARAIWLRPTQHQAASGKTTGFPNDNL